MIPNSRAIWILFGLFLSGLCLWLFLRDTNWEELSLALRKADYVYVLPAVLVTLLTYLVRGIRWELLVLPIKKVSFMNVLSAISIGFMANHLLPARAGEIIRCIVLSKKEDMRTTGVFATVVMERLLDSVSLIIFATVVLAALTHHGPGQFYPDTSTTSNPVGDDLLLFNQLKRGIAILGGVCLVTVVILIFLDVYKEKAVGLVDRLFFFLPHAVKDRILHLLESFVQGMKVLKNIRQVLWLSFLSFGLWILFVVAMVILGYSFEIEIPFAGMCFVCICISLAVALPQAPAYIGVFHFAVQKSLEIFHVALPVAQSFAIVLWATSIFTSVAIGTFFLWKEGLSFSQIVKVQGVSDKNIG
ncbi:MAG TPA: lysylphosphatidylglycerol synthase transmembrane domain-containing protein [Candidatus Avalokitesvara rifleensis]|uniref:lysylphosphatidylglycerol synthase transmembrane domain-containing protein n=1 Tax=Candidatus Avalokitesvara rifleensis TaxID=3367620 RepID=UPI002713A0CE|nr:lysylphosphatidylglycerol synthase transmembrane domain-containing protein [Candidatus Brocadiales bacterium]